MGEGEGHLSLTQATTWQTRGFRASSPAPTPSGSTDLRLLTIASALVCCLGEAHTYGESEGGGGSSPLKGRDSSPAVVLQQPGSELMLWATVTTYISADAWGQVSHLRPCACLRCMLLKKSC